MTIQIYDIDGTLTKIKGDNEKSDPFETYAFWPLITYHFARDPQQLKAEAEAWDRSDKGVGEVFVKTSQDMLQRGIHFFHEGVTGKDLQARAKTITLDFLKYDIVRPGGIAHLNKALKNGNLCILSTGSYTDGAIGFVEALIQQNLLPKDALKKLVISGAEIDWNTRTVTHANVGDNKIKGLYDTCKAIGLEFIPDQIAGIYVDDPAGNDSGLCILKPQCVHLIRTVKNRDKKFEGLTHQTWAEIVK